MKPTRVLPAAVALVGSVYCYHVLVRPRLIDRRFRRGPYPGTSRSVARRSGSRINRLSSFDQSNLRLEKLRSPFHFAGLVILDGRSLLDDQGRLRVQEIRSRLDRRLVRLPETAPARPFPGPAARSCGLGR